MKLSSTIAKAVLISLLMVTGAGACYLNLMNPPDCNNAPSDDPVPNCQPRSE